MTSKMWWLVWLAWWTKVADVCAWKPHMWSCCPPVDTGHTAQQRVLQRAWWENHHTKGTFLLCGGCHASPWNTSWTSKSELSELMCLLNTDHFLLSRSGVGTKSLTSFQMRRILLADRPLWVKVLRIIWDWHDTNYLFSATSVPFTETAS